MPPPPPRFFFLRHASSRAPARRRSTWAKKCEKRVNKCQRKEYVCLRLLLSAAHSAQRAMDVGEKRRKIIRGLRPKTEFADGGVCSFPGDYHSPPRRQHPPKRILSKSPRIVGPPAPAARPSSFFRFRLTKNAAVDGSRAQESGLSETLRWFDAKLAAPFRFNRLAVLKTSN